MALPVNISLKKLSELFGVSGHEDAVREYIASLVVNKCDDMYTDAMGNLIAFRRGRSDKRRVLIGANMDEPGFIVSGITDDGYLKFKQVGSYDPRTAVSKTVVTEKGVRGVIGMKAIHVQTKEEREAAVKAESLYIDIGCKKRSAAEKRVSLGDYIAFDTKYKEIGDRLRGKALGRFGTVCVISAMENVPAYDTYYVFTAQREIPCRVPGRGMACAAYAIRPDAAFIADVMTTSDLAGHNNGDVQLGGGFVIEHTDRASIGNETLINGVRRLLPGLIPERVVPFGSTEAGAAAQAAEGCMTLAVGIPCRYKDTPVNMMDIKDLSGAARLFSLIAQESDVIIDGK